MCFRFADLSCPAFALCSLKKNEEDIPDAQTLLQHPFITKYADDKLDLAEWIVQSLQKVGQYKP